MHPKRRVRMCILTHTSAYTVEACIYHLKTKRVCFI
jgi:hypothetical protein